MKNKPGFHIYKDSRNKFRWRAVALNGRITAMSSESYSRRIDAIRGAAATFHILASRDPVFEVKR